MNPFRTVLYAFLILLSGHSSFAQLADQPAINQAPLLSENANNYNILAINDSTLVEQNSIAYPPSKRDYLRLGYDTGMYIGATIIVFGVLYAMPESSTNWDRNAMKENGITYKWKQNIKAGPVWDNDDWVLNYITHPYSGGVYYMTARSSGFNIFESFLYSAFMSSLFWEYGIEAFAEIPSKQDLIITPVLGSMIGEGFFYAKKSILRHDRKVLNSKILGYTSLLIMDPFNTLLDSFGYKETTKTQLSLAPVGFDQGANKAIWGLNFSAQF